MDVKLTIYSDDKQYFSQAISLPCVIGRARQCGVAIVHPVVSRRHCEIYEENNQVWVRDLGSLNGTVFQGMRIGRGVQLPYGSVFSIGRLFFLIEPTEDLSLMSDAAAHDGPSASAKSSEELRDEMNRRVAAALGKLSDAKNQPDDFVDPEDDPFAIDESCSSDANDVDSEPFSLDDLAPDD